MEEITAGMFNGRTEARLINIDYNVLPIAMNTTVNISNEDEIAITRVDDRSISFEVTRKLIVNPKSLFEISITSYLRRSLGDAIQGVPSLKEIDVEALVSKYKVELTNIAFCNMSYILGSITGSFGGTPLLTPPTPMANAKIWKK